MPKHSFYVGTDHFFHSLGAEGFGEAFLPSPFLREAETPLAAAKDRCTALNDSKANSLVKVCVALTRDECIRGEGEQFLAQRLPDGDYHFTPLNTGRKIYLPPQLTRCSREVAEFCIESPEGYLHFYRLER